MTHQAIHILAIVVTLTGVSVPANAECYADYKAKKSNPLTFHYGVIELPNAACQDDEKMRINIHNRIKGRGWSLLNVISVFGSDGLAQREQDAGKFFLRF